MRSVLWFSIGSYVLLAIMGCNFDGGGEAPANNDKKYSSVDVYNCSTTAAIEVFVQDRSCAQALQPDCWKRLDDRGAIFEGAKCPDPSVQPVTVHFGNADYEVSFNFYSEFNCAGSDPPSQSDCESRTRLYAGDESGEAAPPWVFTGF
jgi:hypothetical protein